MAGAVRGLPCRALLLPQVRQLMKHWARGHWHECFALRLYTDSAVAALIPGAGGWPPVRVA